MAMHKKGMGARGRTKAAGKKNMSHGRKNGMHTGMKMHKGKKK